MKVSSFKFQFLIILVGMFFFVPTVSAFEINPARQTVVVDPGISQIIPLHIVNTEDRPMIFTPEISPFIVDSKNGSPIFNQPDEATTWFHIVPERLQLEPGQDGTFSFTMSIPNSAEPKSHYLGLFARSEPSDGEVGVSTRLGSLLFLHVGGVVYEELVRTAFSAERLWYQDAPITLKVSFENPGTIDVIPTGSIILRNMFQDELATIPLNEEQRKILSGGLWEKELTFDHFTTKLIGPIRADLNVVYGMSGKELHDTATFWVVPWPIVVGFFSIGILLLFILFAVRRSKKRNVQRSQVEQRNKKSRKA